MKNITLILTFCLLNLCLNAQTNKEYEKYAKVFKDYYKTSLNLYMMEYHSKIEVKSWDLKTFKIKYNPTEYALVITEDEKINYTKNELDSLKIVNWYESLYIVSIDVHLLNGEKETLKFWLSPNADFVLVDSSKNKKYFH